MGKIKKLMEYDDASSYDKKKMLESSSFVKDVGMDIHKELTLTGKVEDDLLQREILEVIVEGADYNKVIRDIIPTVVSKSGDKGKVVIAKNESDVFANIVPESGMIPDQDVRYDSVDFDFVKIVSRIKISQELIEDSRWDEVELKLRFAGMKIENALNRYALGIILDGCTQTDIDEISIAKILEGSSKVYDEKFIPDVLLLHQSAISDIYGSLLNIHDEDDEDYYIGNLPKGKSEVFGLQQRILGMNTSDDFTVKWTSTSGTNNYYGLLFDSNAYARIVIRDELNISDIKDFKYDVRNLIAKMRVGVVVIQGKAGIRYKTS